MHKPKNKSSFCNKPLSIANQVTTKSKRKCIATSFQNKLQPTNSKLQPISENRINNKQSINDKSFYNKIQALSAS